MFNNLSHRKATIDDLKTIIHLLSDDELGQSREHLSQELDARYVNAFYKIDSDPNQYLMVVLLEQKIIGTCHLSIIASLTFTGSTRLQIEAVHVFHQYRGQKIGTWMMNAAIEYGKSRGAVIAQLTTNKRRHRAQKFYEQIGFEASHEGMKLYL